MNNNNNNNSSNPVAQALSVLLIPLGIALWIGHIVNKLNPWRKEEKSMLEKINFH